MQLEGITAVVSGGASGLGAASARRLVASGASVVLADVDDERGEALAGELGERTRFARCDVTQPTEIDAALQLAESTFGPLRLAVGCAGIGWAERMRAERGEVSPDGFERVIGVNLVGMYNLLRQASSAIAAAEPLENGERGCVVMTSSIAAFDGQIGQTAYAAAKGGVAALALPAARELARSGVRVVAIAPGLFDTPLLAGLPEAARTALGESVPFPSRLGDPAEFAQLVCALAENPMVNGETVRLDGALRMPPR